ncbi:MAG TPA: ABC transporter substrate-binding protein [Candidatus Binatia bacterium]|jgi:NitT/TauT family transport system substrate-binding protein
MIRRLFFVLMLTVAIFAVPGLLPAAPEIVIGYANISARVSPLWIAQEKGLFAKYGVNVQQVYMPGSPVMIASMSSGQVHLANSGGTAALGAAAGGLDLRVIGTFTSRIPFDLVVRPNIKSPKDLRGKRIGVQVIGGTIWMGAMLGLEHLGLDSRRDDIQIVAAGDQTMLSQALEKGTVDGTVVDSAFSNHLKQRGFPILVELSKTNIPFVSNGIIARAGYLQQQPDAARNTLKAWLEGVAYALSPKMKPAVIETIVRRLKVSNPALAEQGYQDLLRATDRKPYPSVEGLRNVQRLMKLRNAAVADLKAEGLIDARLIQELDQSGFIDQLYNAYAVK